MFIQLLFVLSVKAAFGDNIIIIRSANEFIAFAKNVSSRNTYLGTTVYLGSDLSLSDKTLEPIDYFRGVFDGQGHIIRDLKMSSSTSQYTGLFGNSYGLTIKNIVLDSSCIITNSLSGSNNVYIGGIIGECRSDYGECTIENNVNMADVTFSADTNYNQYIGGIAGELCSSNHPIYVKNCANYGSVTRSGTNVNSLIGGIVGCSEGSSPNKYNYIQNCANYGAITHNGSSTNVRIGGIVGSSYFIQNCVNYGEITHNGTSTNVYISGIVGYSNSYTSIQDCVNYGAITHNGLSTNLDVGGIVGSSYSHIQNCLNYGAITCNGTSTNPRIGGIVGYSYSYIYIQNCLSAGKISILASSSGSSRIGSIVGRINTNTHINYCYHTSDVNVSKIYGRGTPESTTGTPDTPIDVNPELMSKLNSNTTGRNWNKWFILHLNGGSINNIARDPFIGIQGQIPNPVKEGNRFLFWCKDAECTEEFDPETARGVTDLYAAWVNNTVTFDFCNGTTVNETFSYNTEIIYPKREGYTLSWDNYRKLMPARDITITAQWTPNNYTVTFDFGNGGTVNATFSYNTEIIYPDAKKEGYTLSWSNYHELVPAGDITITAQWTPNNYTMTFDANGGNASETSKMITFNEKYGELPEPNRTGYMFLGWFTNETNGTEVTNETIVTTPDNHTLYAQWAKVTNHVEIVFYAKDLAEGEVEEIVRKYTNAEFPIVEYENGNDSGGVRVIIKFSDNERAKNFVETIKESNETNIKNIGFNSGEAQSISPVLCPILFFIIILFIF